MQAVKDNIRAALPKIASQELLNNLFRYPYTKIEFIERGLAVSRITAACSLELLAEHGFLKKKKIGRTNLYINEPLFKLLRKIKLPRDQHN